MPGLDPAILDSIDFKTAIGRINTDVQSDFILSPHYSAIFANYGEEL
ncbi:MAG: hypothetical protein V1799_12760 [bacterium]